MTVSEAQAERTALFNLITDFSKNGVESMTISGRGWKKADIKEIWTRIDQLDAFIDRSANGMFGAVRFRPG